MSNDSSYNNEKGEICTKMTLKQINYKNKWHFCNISK